MFFSHIQTRCKQVLNTAFTRFKELADKKHDIFDEDLHALMSEEVIAPNHEYYKLVSSAFHSETGEKPHAKIVLSAGGAEHSTESEGSGPVDAAFKAIESVNHSGADLLLYSVNAITTGTDAQGEDRCVCPGPAGLLTGRVRIRILWWRLQGPTSTH